MKCQLLFSGKNKKTTINLFSADLAKRVVKVKMRKILFLFQIFPDIRKLQHFHANSFLIQEQRLFHANCLLCESA